MKYKEFGYTKDKTMFPITIVAIFIAIIIIVSLSFLYEDNKKIQIQNIDSNYIPSLYPNMQGGGPQNINQQIPYPTHHMHMMPQIIYPPQSIPVNIQFPFVGGQVGGDNQLNPKIKYKLVPVEEN